MIRFATAILLVAFCLPVLAETPEPIPPVPGPSKIVGPPASGDGSKASPFVYALGSKGKLTLVSTAEKVAWSLDDAVPDTEVLPGDKMLWFPTDTPGIYHVMAACADANGLAIVHAWLEIKGPNGPPIPPTPEDSITTRVKTALKGAVDDAKKFEAVCSELAKALDSGTITRLAGMESSMKAGLDAVGWVPGKYPDLSKLAGELFGVDVPDRVLTAADKATFVRQLKTIATACQAVK